MKQDIAKEILDLSFGEDTSKKEQGYKLRDEHIPPSLFRYRSITSNKDGMIYAFDEIKNNTIHFASPKGFNDPLDSNPVLLYICPLSDDMKKNIVDLIHRESNADKDKMYSILNTRRSVYELIDWLKKEKPNEYVRSYSSIRKILKEIDRQYREYYHNQIGVCCFTESHKDISMWHHYANDFKGICIEYDMSGHWKTDMIFPVYYLDSLDSDENVAVRRYKNIDPNTIPPGDIWNSIPFYKHKDWEHEKEWRIVGTNCSAQTLPLPASIKSVFMGEKIESCYKNKLLSITHQKGIKLFEMRCFPNGIEFVPYEHDVICCDLV